MEGNAKRVRSYRQLSLSDGNLENTGCSVLDMKAIFVSLVVTSALLVSCEKTESVRSESEAMKPLLKTKADNGSSVDLTIGSELEVHLEANKSTGYSWQLKSNDSVAVISDSYAPEEIETVGVGGVQKFTLQAQRSGRSELEFIYSRAWEKGVEPAEKFQLKLNIK